MSDPHTAPWTLLTGLADPYPTAHDSTPRRAVPNLKVIERLEGATVVRLSFRPGDEMADHQAPAPILILGQSGEVSVTVDAGDGSAVTENLTPGRALHIEPRRTHSLFARDAATVTLVILTQ